MLPRDQMLERLARNAPPEIARIASQRTGPKRPVVTPVHKTRGKFTMRSHFGGYARQRTKKRLV